MKIVIERYPETLPLIVMCTLAEVDQRWCYHCAKCMWYGIYSLALGFGLDPCIRLRLCIRDFPVCPVFGRVRGKWRGVGSIGTRNCPVFTHLTRGGQFCHAVATVDLDLIADKISSHARPTRLFRRCSATARAQHTEWRLRACSICSTIETANRVATIIAEHVAVDELPGPFLDEGYIYDFSVRMPDSAHRSWSIVATDFIGERQVSCRNIALALSVALTDLIAVFSHNRLIRALR